VCERANKLADAEHFYRRASAIASASLDSQHPLVITSHNNLRDFCRARGVSSAGADTVVTTRSSRALIGGGLAAVALLVALLATWSTRTPRDPRAADEMPPAAPKSASVPPSVSPSTAGTSRPAAEPSKIASLTSGEAAPRSTATRADVAAAGTADVQVIEAAVCQSLSTSVSVWQCATPSDPAAPGPLYFYTRIAAPKNVRVHHRWYRGDRLRQDVGLAVGANPGAGYRTYSRQTVDAEGGGEWRVELVTADGVILREERVVVR
jgi:hypothetical protein